MLRKTDLWKRKPDCLINKRVDALAWHSKAGLGGFDRCIKIGERPRLLKNFSGDCNVIGTSGEKSEEKCIHSMDESMVISHKTERIL